MTDFIYSDPFLYGTLPKLIPKDVLSCKFINKATYNKINKNIFNSCVIKEINNRLSETFGNKLSEFKTIMQKTHSVISGSLIVQCILGEKWKESDIDIFSPDISIMESFLSNSMLFDVENHYTYDCGYEQMDPIKIEKISNCLTINGIVFQLIQIDVEKDYSKIKNYVCDTFDFGICKNIYYIQEKECVSVMKPNDIYHKTFEFNVGVRLNNSMKRYDKYIDRGFNIPINISYDKMIERETSRMIFQIEDLNKVLELENETYKKYIIECKKLIPKLCKKKYRRFKIDNKNNIEFPMNGPNDVSYNYSRLIENDILMIRDDYVNEPCEYGKCVIKFCKSNDHHFHMFYDDGDLDYIFVLNKN